MLNKETALIFLAAYQNQGTLKDYLDPWIAKWTENFIITGLSDSLHNKIIKTGFDDEDLDEVIQVQADIKPGQYGFERELLEEWTTWIMKDEERRKIVKKELETFFFWQGKPFWEGEGDEIPWLTEPGMPTSPENALKWFEDVFGNHDS